MPRIVRELMEPEEGTAVIRISMLPKSVNGRTAL